MAKVEYKIEIAHCIGSNALNRLLKPYCKTFETPTYISASQDNPNKPIQVTRYSTTKAKNYYENYISEFVTVEEFLDLAYNDIDIKKFNTILQQAFENYSLGEFSGQKGLGAVVENILHESDMKDYVPFSAFVHVTNEGRMRFLPRTNYVKLFCNQGDPRNFYKLFRTLSIGGLLIRAFPSWSPQKIEKFVHDFNAQVTPDNLEIAVVEGDDIRRYYNENMYNQIANLGELGTSCMRYGECEEYFGIYTDNPEQVKMVIAKTANTIVARALLWFIDNRKYIDRIYGNPSIQAQLRKWGKDNGFTDCYETDLELEIKLPNGSHGSWPYLDTFFYMHNEGNAAVLSSHCLSSTMYKLQDTEGLLQGLDGEPYDEVAEIHHVLLYNSDREVVASTTDLDGFDVSFLPIDYYLSWMSEYDQELDYYIGGFNIVNVRHALNVFTNWRTHSRRVMPEDIILHTPNGEYRSYNRSNLHLTHHHRSTPETIDILKNQIQEYHAFCEFFGIDGG